MALAFYRIFYHTQDEQSRLVKTSKLNQTKLILVYTPRASEPWGPRTAEEANNYKFTDWDGTPCEEDRCQITFDKSLRNFSDAVLVHAFGAALSRDWNVELAKRNRPSAQRWVFYTKESPQQFSMAPKGDGVYNWTATYRRDSDFFVPYGSYSTLKIPKKSDGEDFEEQPDENVNYAEGKDKMATFGVSNHCKEDGFRFAFVRALMKHIPVSLYGKCATMFESNNTWKCPHNMRDGCLEEIQRHKFYLAFENSLCVDYITEKYWRNSLERGLVPVVLGGSQYSPELVIPGSFINASVKDRVDYLKYLDKNDTALHDPTKPPKIYHKMSEFWGIKGSCKVDEDRIWNIIKRG